MFEMLKESLSNLDNDIREAALLSEMVDTSDDDFLEAIDEEDLTADEEAQCEKILNSMPDIEADTEKVSKDEMEKADKEIADPSIEELTESLFMWGE